MKEKSNLMVANLRYARMRRPLIAPDGKPLPPYVIYDPSPPYLLQPCQVISMLQKQLRRPVNEK